MKSKLSVFCHAVPQRVMENGWVCGTRTRHRNVFECMSWSFINTLDSEEVELGPDEIGLCITYKQQAGIRYG